MFAHVLRTVKTPRVSRNGNNGKASRRHWNHWIASGSPYHSRPNGKAPLIRESAVRVKLGPARAPRGERQAGSAFPVPTFALPRNVAFSLTTSRGASRSPRSVQLAWSSQRSVTKILPSTVPPTFTDFVLISPRMRACSPIVSVPVESIVPSTSPSISNSFRNLTEPLIETPRERRAPDCVGMNVRLDSSGTTDGSGRFVCGGSVPLRGGKRVKGCMARIVPNYSAFRKRNREIVRGRCNGSWITGRLRLSALSVMGAVGCAAWLGLILPVASLPLRNSKHASLPSLLPMREHGQL